MAIYYEELGDYYKAFDCFIHWFDICCEMYGFEHPRTGRSISTLREPMYKRIAQERGVTPFNRFEETPNEQSPQTDEDNTLNESLDQMVI